MKIAVMLRGVLLVIVAVASSWAHGDEPQPGEGLDPAAGNPTNLKQLSRISDGNTFLNHKSSIGEREQGHLLQRTELQATNVTTGEVDGSDKARKAKGCSKTKKCSKLDGECVSQGSCIGVTTTGCKKTCECCIPVDTTTAPPTTTPTAPPPTCPPVSPCPTTVAPTTIAPGPTTGCPVGEEGFFYYTPSSQCFKYFPDDGEKANYDGSKAKCESENMTLAHTYDPNGLRDYIVNRWGNGFPYLDAKGKVNGPYYWNDNDAQIPKDLLADQNGDCVEFLAHAHLIALYPLKPYNGDHCLELQKVLCEWKPKP